jgi:hypothetical protein
LKIYSGESMMYTELLKNIWSSLYDPQTEVITIVNKFFHPNYEQCINGIYMNRDEYIHHVFEQKKNMTIDVIHYKHILERGNELFAVYYPKGKNINNLPIEAEVISYFHFENQQILKIHGQVRLIKGDLKDVDMENH